VSPTSFGSCLIPFIYNNVQSYLCEFAGGQTSVYAQGALVQAGISTPYGLVDLYNLRTAQTADTLNVVVSTHQPYQLKRVTPTSFTFTAPLFVNGPFQDVNIDSTTYMYVSGIQGSVTVFCSSPIFKPSHVGALISIQEQYLSGIQPWEANKILSVNGTSPVGQYCRSDGKIYLCVAANTSANQTVTGTFQPVHTSGTQMDGVGKVILSVADVAGVSWQYVSSGTGVAQITGYIDPQHVTAVIQSDKGVWSNFPPTVVGPPVTVHGPFTFSGDGTTTAFSPLTAISTTDPNQFLVTVDGVFQDPSTYTITGTTLTFFTAPDAGTNNVVITQVKGNGTGLGVVTTMPVSTYWAIGSFSTIQGWPATVVYFNDRLVFGGTQLQPQTFFTSKTAIYNDFGVSVPQVADDGITATINARRENPIVDLIPLNDLLIGTASTIWRVTHSASVGAITPSDLSLLPQNFYGQQNVASVQTGDTVIYAQWGGRKVRDLVYQFAYDKFLGTELTVNARQIFPYGTTVTRMAFAPEPYGLLFCVRSDGVLCVCTYLPEQKVVAWTHYDTDGFFEDVCVLPENGTFVTYVIVRRTVGGSQVRYIEKFAPREYQTIYDAFFVDSRLTYDGRNKTATNMTFIPSSVGVAIVSVGIGSALANPPFTRQVNTATPHGLVAGQPITISGMTSTGAFNANGDWMVESVVSDTAFIIPSNGSIGTSVPGGVVTSSSTVSGDAGTLIASSGVFVASDVTNRNAIWLNDADGNQLCRLRITQFLSSTIVNVVALTPVPTLSGATTFWTFARTTFSGLTNIAGETAAI